MKIKFEFYNPFTEESCEEITITCSSWDEMMKFGENHADTLMILFDLEEVAWCYTVLQDKIS